MRLLAALAVIALLSVPAVYGQVAVTADNQTAAQKFPVIAYTQDNVYEADLSWVPHQILTDEKVMFIFQFYDYKTGAIVPNLDYQFVVMQDGREVGRISGTTSQSGDYKYFAFDHPGPVTIGLEKIGDGDQSANFNATVLQNPHDTGHVTLVQPPPNLSEKQRSIFPVLEDVFVGVNLALILWLAREPIKRKLGGLKE